MKNKQFKWILGLIAATIFTFLLGLVLMATPISYPVAKEGSHLLYQKVNGFQLLFGYKFKGGNHHINEIRLSINDLLSYKFIHSPIVPNYISVKSNYDLLGNVMAARTIQSGTVLCVILVPALFAGTFIYSCGLILLPKK